jgi:apolipoprotein N-acyltransferase
MDVLLDIFRNRFVLWLSSGVLTGLSFFSPWTWWLSILGLFVFIVVAKSAVSRKEIIWGSVLSGTAHFLLVLSWFWSTYPLDWLNVGNKGSFALIFGVWLTCCIVLGFGRLVPSYFIYHFKNKQSYLYIGIPVVWLIGEVIGSFLFSLYTYGTGSYISAEFSVGYLGYVLAEHGLLIKLAEVGGVFVLSMVVVALASLTHYLFFIKKTKILILSMLLIVLATSVIPYNNPYSNDNYSVAALSTDYEAYVRLDTDKKLIRQQNLLKAVATTLEQDVEYIILPEDSRFTSSFDSPEAVFNFIESFSDKDVILVDSTAEIQENNEATVVSIIYNTKNRHVDKVYKNYLVPTGEYMPSFHAAVIKLFGFNKALDTFEGYYNYQPWTSEVSLSEGSPGVLFCLESLSSVALKRVARESRAPFVAHVVSHSWFNNPWLLHHQLNQMMKVNTIFAKTTVYQASNQYKSIRY